MIKILQVYNPTKHNIFVNNEIGNIKPNETLSIDTYNSDITKVLRRRGLKLKFVEVENLVVEETPETTPELIESEIIDTPKDLKPLVEEVKIETVETKEIKPVKPEIKETKSDESKVNESNLTAGKKRGPKPKVDKKETK